MSISGHYNDPTVMLLENAEDAVGLSIGDPFGMNDQAGILMNEVDSVELKAWIKVLGMVETPVKGEDGSGNTAVSEGDKLYWTDGEAYVSKKATGIFIGKACQAVSSGATDNIWVALAGITA